MNKKRDEFVEQQLLRFPEKDVLVYYRCRDLRLSTYGFYIWEGSNHIRATISELLQDGFEKGDIKELRNGAVKICLVEDLPGRFEVREGKGE